MEAFSITCTTCQSRLKVQSLSAIGQILACPKCQSMVKVEPPDGWAPPQQETAADVADDKPAGQASQLPSKSANAGQTPLESNSFDDAADSLAGTPVPDDDSQNPSLPDTPDTATGSNWREPSPSPAADDETPVLPDSSWTSSASRKPLLFGGIALAVVLLCVVAFVIGRARESETDEPRQSAAIENDSTDETEEGGDEPRTDPEPDSAEPQDDADDVETESGTDENRQTDAEPVGNDTTAAEAVNDAPSDPASEGATDEDVAAPPEAPDGPPGLVEKAEDKPAEDPEFSAPSLLAELDKFSELMEDPTISGGSAEGDEVADVLAPGDVLEEDPVLPRPAARDVDVAARLNDPLPGIEFTDLPLAAFVRFVSDFSTIPISIAPEALIQRQITPQTPVSILQTETTVGRVLGDVLAMLELGFVQRGNQLVIVAASSSEPDSLRTVEYDLSDVSSGSADDAKVIAGWITALVSPKTWKVNGGPGVLEVKGTSLSVQQSEPVHFQVLTFCEKLRVARGLPHQSSYPAELFRLDEPSGISVEGLNRPVSMIYLDDVRLVGILDRARSQSGVHILVDWHALAESGWNPDAKFPFSVDKKPLRQMLDRLLNRMELTYRVAGPNTIQITTERRLMLRTEIKFHRVGGLLSDRLTAEELTTGVKSTLGEAHFLDHAGAIRVDQKSGYLIAALPRAQQQALAHILVRLRERDPASAE